MVAWSVHQLAATGVARLIHGRDGKLCGQQVWPSRSRQAGELRRPKAVDLYRLVVTPSAVLACTGKQHVAKQSGMLILRNRSQPVQSRVESACALAQADYSKRVDPNDKQAQVLLEEMRAHIKKVHVNSAPVASSNAASAVRMQAHFIFG